MPAASSKWSSRAENSGGDVHRGEAGVNPAINLQSLHRFAQCKLFGCFFIKSVLLESVSLSGRNVLLSGILHRERGVDSTSFFAAEGGICLSGLMFPATPSEICPVVAAAAPQPGPLAVPLSAKATRAAFLCPWVMGSSLSRVWQFWSGLS